MDYVTFAEASSANTNAKNGRDYASGCWDRIGSPNDSAAIDSSLFAGQQKIYDKSVINNIQKGVINIPTNELAYSGIITSVDTSKAFVVHNGVSEFNETHYPSSRAMVDLTSATVVTATRAGETGSLLVAYTVVEYT